MDHHAALLPRDAERRDAVPDPLAEARAAVRQHEPRQATAAHGDPAWWVDVDAYWWLDAITLPSGDEIREGVLWMRWR